MCHLKSRRRKSKSAQVLVEFALCVPLLVVLFGCCLDLGLLMWKEQMLTRTARDGALFASRICSNSTEWLEASPIKIIDEEGYGRWEQPKTNEERSTDYIMGVSDGTGLESSEISIAVSSTDTAINGYDSIEVNIDHTHRFLTPFSGLGDYEYQIKRTWKAAFIKNKVGTGPDNWF
mgnify:CR=1 FL=1